MFWRTVLVLVVLTGTSARPAACAQTPESPAAPPAVYKSVSSETLERILKDLKIDSKKTPGKKNHIYYYEYTRNGYTIRLHNYDGKDLWIEALFTDRLALADVNRWNVRAKFSRCVLLQSPEKTTVSLENQFDCLGGCTDAIVRQFIVRFDSEVREFANYVKNTQTR